MSTLRSAGMVTWPLKIYKILFTEWCWWCGTGEHCLNVLHSTLSKECRAFTNRASLTHVTCMCDMNIVTGFFFCECDHSLHAKAGRVLHIRSWPHSFTSVPVHYAWIILPFRMCIIRYTESVIKPDINMCGLKLLRWQQWILGRSAVSLWSKYWPGWLLVMISLQIQILLLLLFLIDPLACFPSINLELWIL